MATTNVARESMTAMVRKTSWVMAHGDGNLERAMARRFFVETFINAGLSKTASPVETIGGSSTS